MLLYKAVLTSEEKFRHREMTSRSRVMQWTTSVVVLMLIVTKPAAAELNLPIGM